MFILNSSASGNNSEYIIEIFMLQGMSLNSLVTFLCTYINKNFILPPVLIRLLILRRWRCIRLQTSLSILKNQFWVILPAISKYALSVVTNEDLIVTRRCSKYTHYQKSHCIVVLLNHKSQSTDQRLCRCLWGKQTTDNSKIYDILIVW
jgi:hypothetical protein